jgi:hypothetical protein
MSQKQQQIQHLYFGLDLGKRRDYSALAILEYIRPFYTRQNFTTYTTEAEYEEPRYAIRFLERIPLETRYTDVVGRISAKIYYALNRSYDCTLIVDATGVGQPVVEMFRDLPPRATLAPVVITAGGSESKAKDEWRVPKNDLIAGLQVMLESGSLKIATGLKYGDALMEELLEFRSAPNSKGSDSYEGPQDDLVLALSLAVWRARKHELPQTRTSGFRNKDIGIHSAPTSPWGRVKLF